MRRTLFLSIAIASLTASAAYAVPVELASPAPVSISSDREACAAQAFLPWCGGGVSGDNAMTLAEVSAINQQYASRVHYQRRPGLTWRSSFGALPATGKWRADCADLSLTTLDALARAGFPTDRMWRMIVVPGTRKSNPSRPGVLHMVGVVEIDGTFYVVGDTNSLDRVYRLDQANFVPTMVSRVSEGRMWRRTVEQAARSA